VFGAIGSLIWLAVAGGATLFGFWQSRSFVQNKLRYVDAIHKAFVPALAGIGAALLMTPVALFLPFVTTMTALLFGAGVAMGVASGARDVRKRLGSS
jgi:hypothetical protein